MDIGKQIKALRLRRGVTQEAIAQHFGITAQAVSKWECGSSVPDIGMLPGLSAYFGVSIDELFALSDEVRMERIENMLWDVRFLDPADAEKERHFLLEKAAREPQNSAPHEMLASLELHLAQEHKTLAAEYALEALARAPRSVRGYAALAHAMDGRHVDPRNNTHTALISHYKTHLARHPDDVHGCAWLIAQLLDDHRIEEARCYCGLMEQHDSGYFPVVHRIKIALEENDRQTARALIERLEKDYPENWSVLHWIGDFHTRMGEYSAAKNDYAKAMSAMSHPRYTDPIDSLAQVCEMDGDIPGALRARRYELEILETDWGDTVGETVDAIHREILRLEALLPVPTDSPFTASRIDIPGVK